MPRTSLTAVLGIVLLTAGCADTAPPVERTYLDASASRSAVIASLDRGLCNHHLDRAASFERFWVGTCSDRTVFEQPVFFMVFPDAAGKRTWLRDLEACVSGKYVEGPRWFAMTVRSADEKLLVSHGAEPLPCTNTRLPPED